MQEPNGATSPQASAVKLLPNTTLHPSEFCYQWIQGIVGPFFTDSMSEFKLNKLVSLN